MRAPASLVVLLGLQLIASGGCKNLPEWNASQFAAPTPGEAWIPNSRTGDPWFESPSPPARPPPEEADLGPESELDLAHLLDVALSNSPTTQASWASARAAAAGYGAARGELYPSVSVLGEGAVSNADNPYNYTNVNNDTATWLVQGGATLDYLLTDFGGRKARVGEARQALYAANWLQNQALQNVVRAVAQAYYQRQGAAAEVVAYETSLEDAATATTAAQTRLEVGMGTISDVLQAQAKEAQVRVDLAGARGETKVAQGGLAVAVGWPANTAFAIGPAADELPFDALVQDADQLIDLSYQRRPLLAAGLAIVREREQSLLQAKALRRPSLSGSAFAGEQLLRGGTDESGLAYEATLKLNVPLFTGGTLRSGVREAEARLDEARAELSHAEQAVSSAVWSSYYAVRTAVDQVRANEALLESSTEAYAVALTRFENGLGDIVELLNALSLLADARAQLIQARTNALTSYAGLVHAVGQEVPTLRE